MQTAWNKKTWNEKKKAFRIGALTFLFFIILTFFQTPEYKKEDLTFTTIELTEVPSFQKNCKGESGCSYWLELNPNTFDLKVFAIDYKYLKHRQFKKDIKVGDKLKVGAIDNIVLTLSKDEYEYLQFDKAQFHKQRNRLFSRYLFSTGFVLCLIPLFFNKQPILKSIYGEELKVEFSWVLGVGLVLCFFILISIIGLNFISGGEFVE